MERKQKKNKTREKQGMHNTISYHPLANAESIPQQWQAPMDQLPPICVLGMMFCA